jgi:hypothetical protein
VELENLIDAVDALVDSDAVGLSDPESIRLLARQVARLQGVMARATGAFEQGGEWSLCGARSAAAWIATECALPQGAARGLVRRGRQVGQLPAVARPWLEGEITTEAFDALVAHHRGPTEATFERDQALLVDQARTLRFEELIRALRYWEQLADPNGAEESEMARRARRDAYLAPSLGGLWLGQMTLDAISGSIVSGELERLERQLFEADWAEATGRLGREPRLTELARTPAQRRADALVEMATRSAAAPPGARRPAPLFSVLVDYPTLLGRVCQLAHGGGVITPGALVPWLDQAYLERAVFAPGKRAEVSATARLFAGATRRAIELRDQCCTHPYCDEPAERCQADHNVEYAAGGLTTQENGRLLCPFHNRQRNARPPPQRE